MPVLLQKGVKWLYITYFTQEGKSLNVDHAACQIAVF